MSRDRPRASLRRRFAIWMALAILASLAAYGVIVYVLVGDEMTEIRTGREARGERGGEEVLEALLLAGPIALVGGAAAAWFLARRALAPIDDVVAAAAEMTASDLHRRLPVPARQDELRELVVTLNGLLARLEDGFGALAREAAEASHELRTPLAVIATDLEVALRRPRDADEWERVAGDALAEIRRLAGLVEGLLELARAGAAPAASGAAVDLVAIGELVCGSLTGAAEARGVALELDGAAGATVRGHAGALEGAVHNLVANAIRHAPAGGRVRILVEAGAGEVRVHVDDSGPGVAPADRARVFEPFWRRPGADDGAGGAAPRGVGLGLAVVQRVATAHGGQARVEGSPLGGARFTIVLPTAAAEEAA